MQKLFKGTQKGFTLIELLVVVAIISLMSSVVLASLQAVRSKARDTKRVSEVRTMEKALTLYALDNGGYIPKSNYTTMTGVGSNVVPKKLDGTIDCALNKANTDTLYDILVPKYLSNRPASDPLEDLGYCYVYISSGDIVYTAGAEYNTQGVLVSEKVPLLATVDTSTKNKAGVFFSLSENTLTNSGNNALVGVSFGVTPPIQLNVDLTTGIRSNTSYDQVVDGGQCGDNAVNNNGTCECNVGYHMNNGTCDVDILSCPTNEHQEAGSCVCDSGYTRDVGGTCQQDMLVCGSYEHQEAGSCVCDSGYTRDVGGTCQQDMLVCGSYEHQEAGSCVCDSGYTWNGSYCEYQ